MNKPYESAKIYGPYLREDGRKHIIAIFPLGTRMTVSYPRYLMEIKIGRYLKNDEEVHHKDDDFTNDEENNLEILNSTIHKNITRKNYEEIWICANCGIPFIVSPIQVARRKANLKKGKCKTGPFCSKQCSGKINN